MNEDRLRLGSVLVGFYAWVVTAFFGVILVDRLYASILADVLGPLDRAAVFSSVSDVLLILGAATILAAFGAIASTWESSIARNLFIASLLLLSLEFLTPLLVLRFVPNAQELGIGPWLRIVPSGLASMLALIALYQYKNIGRSGGR